MTPLRQRFIDDLKIRNYAPSTIESYTYHVACFAKFHGRSPEELGPEETRAYQVHLVTNKKVSWSTFNQTVCALRFLYRVTLPKPWPVEMIPFGKQPKTLPVVLGGDEVQRVLACVTNPFYRTVLTTLYAAGLRLQEGLHLRLTDIDSARMLLQIRHGKGAKDRTVPLSPRLLGELREHWSRTTPRPTTWLFPGRHDQPYSETNIQKVCHVAAAKAKLNKRVTPHTLRHSYATGLLEAGVDLLTIQKLLGHRSFSTTLIYLHVRQPHMNSVTSPLDLLPISQCPRIMPPEPTAPPPTTSDPPPPNDPA
jgi:integrase/recombinase XerD